MKARKFLNYCGLTVVTLLLSVASYGQTTKSVVSNPNWENHPHWSGSAPKYNMDKSAILDHNSTVSKNISIPSGDTLTINTGDTLVTTAALNVKNGGTLIVRGVVQGSSSNKIVLVGSSSIVVESTGKIHWNGDWNSSAPGANITIDGEMEISGDFTNKGTVDGTGSVSVDGTVTNSGSLFGCTSSGSNCCTTTPCVLEQAVLPVNILDFTASADQNEVLVEWSTASERNNSHFIIERSGDNQNFTYLDIITGNGTSNTENTYTYIDENPIKGVNYYKLIQVDYDGYSTELGIKAVSLEINSGNIDLYPSIVSNLGELQLKSEQIINVRDYQVYNSQGQLVFVTKDINGLSDFDAKTGIYFIRIQHTEGIETEKIIVK